MIYLRLLTNQISGKADLISYNNYIAKVEITLVIKKIQVLGPITFKNCSFFQEDQNFIRVLGLINFGGCSYPQKIQNSIKVLRPKTFKG